MTKSIRQWLQSAAKILIHPAFIVAALGLLSAILFFKYQQAATETSLRTAFAGEIEAIVIAVRRPARFAASAWENNRRLPDYKFYFPRAVFDGNVSRLGDLGDTKLVRDIAYLYSMLEHAREEGRRLEAGTSDEEGMLRYTLYLCSAYGDSMRLVQELTKTPFHVISGASDESRLLNIQATKMEFDFLNETIAKIKKVALSPPKVMSK